MILDITITDKLKELIKKAEEKKVWGDRTLNAQQAAIMLSKALPTGGQINCWDAMSQDLKTACLLETIRMWCDPVIGLASAFPQQVIQVSEFILNNC